MSPQLTSRAVDGIAASRGLDAFGSVCLEAIRAHRHYLLIVAIFVPLAPIMGALSDTRSLINLSFQMPRFVLLAVLFGTAIVLGHMVWYMVTQRPTDRLLPSIVRDFKARFLQPQRLANFLVAVVPVPLFFSAYNSIKRTIPYINSFSWDERFAQWDKFLHGGVHPYEILQPLLGDPLVTSIISGLYTFWFVVLMLTVVWQGFQTRRPRLRMQFFITFLLSWIIFGNVAATLLSSAGPVYYENVLGAQGPYQALLGYLNMANEQHAIISVRGHKFLWDVYMTGGANFGSGISAMPSMHVAMTTLFTIVAWRTNRALGIAYLCFAVIIQMGSVHLAWHYAIDGYVSTIGVLALWWAIGRIMFIAERRTSSRGPAAAASSWSGQG